MVSTEKFYLRWDNFESNISSAFRDLKEDKDFSDVTLACFDQQVEAHKVILAASSNFFKKVLKNIKHSHPLIYMKGVKFTDLEAVLNFLYHGEVNVAEADLNNFLDLCGELEVKGLRSRQDHSEGSTSQGPQLNSRPEPQPTAPPLQSVSQAPLRTPSHTEREWSASENNNDCVKREPESSQLVNNLRTPVEEIDHCAGYEEFNQENGDEFDLNNYIEAPSLVLSQFKCNVCGHVSSKKDTVKMHVESQHFPGMTEYTCEQCEKKFNTMRKYRNHRYRHHSNKK